MSGLQRILVVTTSADATDLTRLANDVRRDPVVLTAPTAEAARVVRALGVEARAEVLLAPVRTPPADRGHQLDDLVRRHAVRDRFRDVVVVTDPASATLLLRVLAPDEAAAGSVTVVGLTRGDRPVAVRRAVVAGAVLGVVAVVGQPLVPVLALPGAVALLGAAVALVPPERHLGRELLLVAAVAVGVAFVLVAGSARFPGGW